MRTIVVAGVMALAMVGSARAAPYPWLDIGTGAGGYAVDLTADVDTITITGGGPALTSTSVVDLTLSNVTFISAEMDFGSPCEFTVGCVISAPVNIALHGMAGDLTVLGLPGWDGNPAGTPLGFVSGDLSFARSGGFVDNEQYFAISAVPEPVSLSLLGVGLLGLAGVRKRAA